MESNDVFEDLKAFIAEETGHPVSKIGLDTMLEKDIRIYGDDIYELLQKYQQKYGVSLADFDYRAHFADEGLWLIGTPSDWIRVLFFRKRPAPLKDLTVGELYKGILEKKLTNAER